MLLCTHHSSSLVGMKSPPSFVALVGVGLVPEVAAPTSLMRVAFSKKLGACRLVSLVAIEFWRLLTALSKFLNSIGAALTNYNM